MCIWIVHQRTPIIKKNGLYIPHDNKGKHCKRSFMVRKGAELSKNKRYPANPECPSNLEKSTGKLAITPLQRQVTIYGRLR